MPDIDPLTFPWERDEKPFFVNNAGVEWYIDEDTTKWAHRENLEGTRLPNIYVFFIKDKEYLTRGIMDKNTDKLIYENQSFEAICAHIDMLKLVKELK